jgi:DNA adenine methylase
MKYPGSKWGSADWIISHFPEHHSYLEPFFGSGGVFFNKPRSDIETINDLDGEVVNLFRQIRNDPERLARENILHTIFTGSLRNGIPERTGKRP